jgi:hypothetical protein
MPSKIASLAQAQTGAEFLNCQKQKPRAFRTGF